MGELGNIFGNIFYNRTFDKLLTMTDRSNASQKNKGDIGEMVSLPFTCVKNIYGNYIRNYVDIWGREKHRKMDDIEFTIQYKTLSIVVGYIAPNKNTIDDK